MAKTNSKRLIFVSNEQGFFGDFEAQFGDSLPIVGASYGNGRDLYCAALAEVSARVKRSVEKLLAAEALASVVSLRDPSFMDSRRPSAQQAWMDLGLFWKHDFGMQYPLTGEAGTQKRIAWQRSLASEVEAYVESLHSDAAEALAHGVRTLSSHPRYFTLNPLGWKRSGWAEIPYAGPAESHVVDLVANLETSSQLVTEKGEARLRILVSNVPAVGHKVFEVRPGRDKDISKGAPMATGGSQVNAFYTVSLSRSGPS